MLVHIYTGQNMFFIRIKEAFHTVVSPDATICIALCDLLRWLTPLLASPNATFRVTKHLPPSSAPLATNFTFCPHKTREVGGPPMERQAAPFPFSSKKRIRTGQIGPIRKGSRLALAFHALILKFSCVSV